MSSPVTEEVPGTERLFQGMSRMKQNDLATIARNKASCVVIETPKAAVGLNSVDRVTLIKRVPEAFLDLAVRNGTRRRNGK